MSANISEPEEMTLTAKNFGYDLFSFNPEWREEEMDQLLDGVKNPLDFKQVLESNADKVRLDIYPTDNTVYWNANDVGKILGYADRKMKDAISKAKLTKGLSLYKSNRIKPLCVRKFWFG